MNWIYKGKASIKTAVIGSRSFYDCELLNSVLDKIYIGCMISGGAMGADHLAQLYAEKKGIEIIIHKPNYDFFGRRAPIVRNDIIINEADSIIAFWDGKSKGTKYVINQSRLLNKPIRVVYFNNKNNVGSIDIIDYNDDIGLLEFKGGRNNDK